MRVNRFIGLTAAGLMLGGGIALAPAASAAPDSAGHAAQTSAQHAPMGWKACPKSYLCAWTGKNFTGRMGKVKYNNNNLRQYPTFNKAKSMRNNGAKCKVRVYSGKNRKGGHVDFPKGTQLASLSGTPLKNGAGSNHWC